MSDPVLDDKSKSYFQLLGRYLAYTILTAVVAVVLSITSALVGKWTGITPTLPTFTPPPMPVKAQEPAPAPVIPAQAI